MGRYHNPADEIAVIGRRLGGGIDTYNSLRCQLHADEILVGVFDKGIRVIAPWIYSQSEYDEFHNQYSKGWFLSEKYYAVPKDQFNG